MKKKFFASSLLTLTLILGGCGNKNDNSIVVYTNSGSNGRSEYLTELAKSNGFNVNIVSGGGTDIANRLVAEKNKPIADVVFGLNSIEYEKLKKDNIFTKFEPTWAKDLPKGLSDSQGYYHAVSVTPLVAIYNPNLITGNNIPKDWTDLATNEYFKNKYSIFGLEGGTAKVILSSILTRYQDPKGDLGISQEGWAITKDYIQNANILTGEEDWFGDLMTGTKPVTMIWGSGAIERMKANNYPVGVMLPNIGVPHVVEQLAVINGSDNIEESQKFINWLGSPEIQSKWSEKFGTTPAHPKALENAPQEIKDFMAPITVQEMDWNFITNNIDSWVEKVELEFVK